MTLTSISSSRRFWRAIVRTVSRVALLVLTLTVLLSPTAAAAVSNPRASLPDIEDEVMCPICGTLLELSEAPQAVRERVFIRRLIAEGQSKE
jgi:cytochrome c-type biogenesis protein CcmH